MLNFQNSTYQIKKYGLKSGVVLVKSEFDIVGNDNIFGLGGNWQLKFGKLCQKK